MSVGAVRQQDEVDDWLDQEVQAGRLLLPLRPETIARIVGIVSRAPSRAPARRSKKNRLGPAQALAVTEVRSVPATSATA